MMLLHVTLSRRIIELKFAIIGSLLKGEFKEANSKGPSLQGR